VDATRLRCFFRGCRSWVVWKPWLTNSQPRYPARRRLPCFNRGRSSVNGDADRGPVVAVVPCPTWWGFFPIDKTPKILKGMTFVFRLNCPTCGDFESSDVRMMAVGKWKIGTKTEPRIHRLTIDTKKTSDSTGIRVHMLCSEYLRLRQHYDAVLRR
jgi:hypothetical protein